MPAWLFCFFSAELTGHSLDGFELGLVLCDLAGQENYEHLRKMVYPGVDIILLCLDVTASISDSTKSILTKWQPELSEHCPGVPVVLVAVGETDIQDEKSTASPRFGHVPLKDLERWAVASRIGAVGYTRCDIQTGEGVNDVFELVS